MLKKLESMILWLGGLLVSLSGKLKCPYATKKSKV